MTLPRYYDEEFKRNAVELCRTSGKTVTQVAQDLGISSNMLCRWRRQVVTYSNRAFPGMGKQRPGTDLEEENRRLKKELALVQEERDILKKAMAIFSRATNDLSFHPGTHGRVPYREDVPGS